MAGEFGKLSRAQEEVICSFCSIFGFIPDFISHTHVYIYIHRQSSTYKKHIGILDMYYTVGPCRSWLLFFISHFPPLGVDEAFGVAIFPLNHQLWEDQTMQITMVTWRDLSILSPWIGKSSWPLKWMNFDHFVGCWNGYPATLQVLAGANLPSHTTPLPGLLKSSKLGRLGETEKNTLMKPQSLYTFCYS